MKRKIALIAGIGYLFIFFTGFFANFFVLESIYSPTDATETLSNLLQSKSIFRFGILSFLIMVIFDLVLTWALYILFRDTDKDISLLSAMFRLVNTAIFGVAVYKLIDILSLMKDSNNAVMINQLFNSFNIIWLVGLIFFGIHLLFLGYLIIKSTEIKKFIGYLLIIAGLGYLIDSFAFFMMQDYSAYKDIFQTVVIIPGVVGEFSLTIILLIKGFKRK
jgi:hypothetical protein